jgi:hypothetical protein
LQEIKDLAEKQNASVDQIVAVALAAQVSAWRTRESIASRAKRVNWQKADEILGRVPDIPLSRVMSCRRVTSRNGERWQESTDSSPALVAGSVARPAPTSRLPPERVISVYFDRTMKGKL